MTVGYSLCCTLPPSPSLSPPSPAPTFLSSSLVRAALLSVPLSPSISGKRRREKGRENTTVERLLAVPIYRAAESSALPIAGKFKPCHRGGQFFLDGLCLLGDRPRSRKSRPLSTTFLSYWVYCFRDRESRFLDPRPSAILFCF